MKFSCDASLDQFPVIINWMVSLCSSFDLIIILPQSEDRSDRVVYPEVNLVNVMLHPQIDSDISEELFCCIVTDTSCATTITDRDVVYTVIVNNTNVIGSTVNISKFNGRAIACGPQGYYEQCLPLHGLSQQGYCLLLKRCSAQMLRT